MEGMHEQHFYQEGRSFCFLNGREYLMEPLRVRISVVNLTSAYTCDGEDKSPAIEVGAINVERSKCLAVICNDPDAPGGEGFIHWIAWNIELARLIPEKIPKEPVVTLPIKIVQGTNSFGKIGYYGPCPPHGQKHRYFFKIYGLDTELDLAPGATKEQFVQAMTGHVVQYGETTTTYGR
jgi:Raf kinase inhibitor-like YbhB/YbcL family protein